MIIESGRKLNRSSWAAFIGAGEVILAVLLYFYPDYAKVFLFVLPVVLLYAAGAELLYKYYKKHGNLLNLIGGIISGGLGVFLLFCGRKTFMVGVAVMMLMEVCRQFAGAKSERAGKLEKMVWFGAALLSFVWMVLILFKGLHLYWSVREYLAFYFLGSAFLSFLRRS